MGPTHRIGRVPSPMEVQPSLQPEPPSAAITGNHEWTPDRRFSQTAQAHTTANRTGRHGANRPGSQEVRGFESLRLHFVVDSVL